MSQATATGRVPSHARSRGGKGNTTRSEKKRLIFRVLVSTVNPGAFLNGKGNGKDKGKGGLYVKSRLAIV
jgi:hypothetical protein